MLLIVTGVASGMVYYLTAAGLSIVIAGMDIVNFGAGAYYMFGAFLCYQITKTMGFGWSFLFIPLIIAAIGFCVERILRKLYGREKIYQLLFTMGIAYILQDILVFFYGYKLYTVNLPKTLKTALRIGSFTFPKYYIFIIVVGGTIAMCLNFVFYKTKIGIIFRAIISDRTMANAMGINVGKMFALMFAIATGLTGLAGVIISPTITITATDSLGVFVNVMTVLRIGGWKSLKGAFIASVMMGIINAVAAKYLGSIYSVIPTIIMLVVLLVKPEGLFPEKR